MGTGVPPSSWMCEEQTIQRTTFLLYSIVSVICVSGILTVGCRRSTGGKGSQTPEEYWADTLDSEVRPRAAFDLDCAAEKLELKCMDSDCGTVGAKGCGRKVSYTYLRSDADSLTGQWIQQGGVTQQERVNSPAESEPPVPESQ